MFRFQGRFSWAIDHKKDIGIAIAALAVLTTIFFLAFLIYFNGSEKTVATASSSEVSKSIVPATPGKNDEVTDSTTWAYDWLPELLLVLIILALFALRLRKQMNDIRRGENVSMLSQLATPTPAENAEDAEVKKKPKSAVKLAWGYFCLILGFIAAGFIFVCIRRIPETGVYSLQLGLDNNVVITFVKLGIAVVFLLTGYILIRSAPKPEYGGERGPSFLARNFWQTVATCLVIAFLAILFRSCVVEPSHRFKMLEIKKFQETKEAQVVRYWRLYVSEDTPTVSPVPPRQVEIVRDNSAVLEFVAYYPGGDGLVHKCEFLGRKGDKGAVSGTYSMPRPKQTGMFHLSPVYGSNGSEYIGTWTSDDGQTGSHRLVAEVKK